ncbi:PREDICTED: GATA zinc finger domain-containing protein 14-like, partial [Polistes dominula]|uniref:GATA zinc finger domain-containing protein 14-like n=1 Tax=Polistes dominula TaxID=743375 RepID=A0ABM1J9T3_POLDO
MAIKRISIIILSILFTQSLSLPNGCIESCTTYRQVSSYRTHQESGNRNDHTDSNIRNVNHLNLNYDRPGNWTEQNEYKVDNGHGKVYEEQGQYVEGPKRVRYFKKNYTSSYSNIYPSNSDLLQSERLINQNRNNALDTTNSQRIYEESRNSESYRQEHNYNKLHNDQLQQTYRERGSNIERLENLGKLSDRLQISQHGTSVGDSELLQGQNQHIGIRNDNWTRVNTYKTDDGNGRVSEEEGQYVIGPKTTRYYHQNYTSQYSTSFNPIHKITPNINDDLHSTIEKVNQEFENMERKIHQSSRLKQVTSSNTLHTDTMNTVQDNVNPTFRNIDLQVAESADYRHRDQNEHVPTNGNIYNVHQNQLSNRQIYTGDDTLYRNENNVYNRNRPTVQHQREEAYISQSHINVLPSNIPTLNSENNNYQRYRENEQIGLQRNINENYQREYLDTHQSQITQNYRSRDNLQHRTLNENMENYPHIRDGILQHQNWDVIGQRREIVNPNERNQYYSHQKISTYNKEIGHTLDNNYNPGYTGNLQQISSTQGHNHGMQDCAQIEQRYMRKYKRNAGNDGFSKIRNRQNYEKFRKDLKDYDKEKLPNSDHEIKSLRLPNKDLKKNTKDMIEQTQNNKRKKRHILNLEDIIAQNFDDLTQQTTGHIGFDQLSQKPKSHNQYYEDLTQQINDLAQQLGVFDDLTQQTSGHIEFGQKNQKPNTDDKYSEYYAEQIEDLLKELGLSDLLKQQTSGHIEFSQHNQKQNSQRLNHEELTKEIKYLIKQIEGFDDSTQQTFRHVEFGQQNQKPASRNQRFKDLTQQTDDLTQQTAGHIEFGQQNHKPGSHKQRFEDLTQQTSGQIEFGQQNQKPGSHNQRFEDLTQQSDDLTQQTSGHLEFGQQNQKPGSHNQRFEDLTQQSDDLTQQTSGHLEFGQHSQKP